MLTRTILVVMVLLGTSNDPLNIKIMMIALAAIIMAGLAVLLFILVDLPRRHEPAKKFHQPQSYYRIEKPRNIHRHEKVQHL